MGDIARLHSAVLAYARDFMIDKGFTYCIPPYMIRSKVVTGVMSFEEMDATEIAAADPRARNPYLRRSEIKRTLLVLSLIHIFQITGKYKPLTPPQEPVDISVEDDPAPAEASAVQPRDEGGEQE